VNDKAYRQQKRLTVCSAVIIWTPESDSQTEVQKCRGIYHAGMQCVAVKTEVNKKL